MTTIRTMCGKMQQSTTQKKVMGVYISNCIPQTKLGCSEFACFVDFFLLATDNCLLHLQLQKVLNQLFIDENDIVIIVIFILIKSTLLLLLLEIHH